MSYSNQVLAGRSIWRDPITIAAIASVGFHALLWVVLPHLKLNTSPPREPEIQRKVGLVQLTPEEQSRLPQFNDTAPNATALPVPSGNPPLPPSNSFSLAPLPSPSAAFPPPSAFYGIPLPDDAPISVAPTRRLPLPTRPSTPQPTQPPRSSPSSTETLRRMQENGRFSEIFRGGTVQAPLQQPSPSPGSSPNPTATPPQNPGGGTNSSDRPSSLAENFQAERNRIAVQMAPTAQGVQNDDDASAAYGLWFTEELGRSSGDVDRPPAQESIALRYPREACPLRQTAEVRYGVVVDKDNKITGNPKLLQSGGRRIFDDQALEATRNHTFNNSTGADQIYVVSVTFAYSSAVCPAVVPQQSPPS